MGRKAYFARLDGQAKERRRLRRQMNGYVPGAHKEEDAVRNKDKKLPKTKELHQQTLDLWFDFTADPENGFQNYKTVPGCLPPSHDMVKAFIRWYADSTDGRLDKSGKPTVRTTKACAERFFGGFREVTKTEVPETDRKEIYGWIKNTLTKEGKVVNQKKQKYNFRKDDFLKVVSSMWRADHKRFIPGLIKVQILFALQLYLFTGARVGSFMPPDENKRERGLRYEHIDLVLFPSSTTPWEIAWRVNQVWLKNNRDSDYTVFGIGIRDSKRPQFASGDLLLGLALAHGALFGIETEADLAKYDLTNGEIPLRWKESYLKKPIFRNVTGHGPQDIPLTNKDFYQYLHLIFDAAGYSEHPTIHDARRNLAKEVEKRYGSAPVSQILAQRDPKTFPEHYQAHCSSIDTVSAVLDENVQTKHIEYFQGYGQFCEPGLPLELPAHMKESILMLPKMAEIRADIQIYEENNDQEKLQAKKREYREALFRQRRADLKKYQESWIQAKRDQNILNRGKGKPLQVVKDICTRAQYLIMPELARIATAMAGTAELTFQEKLFFVGDLRTLCSRKEDVIYLPNEQPIEGFCPAQGCQLEIENLTKGERSAHIHECVRREKGLALQVPKSRLHFCYECMEWFLKRQWQDHCNAHLQSWQTQHCEVVKYRHTVIRPAYCPFCLWNLQNSAEERLQYWTRSGNLRQHIETKHMPEISWPTTTSVCGCSQTFENERELRHHLHDVHGLNDTIWRNPKLPRKRKRTSKIEPHVLSQKSGAGYSKKVRFHRYPPPHQEHEYQLSNNIFAPTPTVNSFITEYPQKHYCSSRSEKSSSSSGNSSVVSYFSAANSPLSSRPITPELDVIDPRILEAFDSGQENEPQPCDITAKLDSHTSFVNEFDNSNHSLNDISQPLLPVPTIINEQAGMCNGDEVGENINAAREECAASIFLSYHPTTVEGDDRNDVFAEGEKDSANEMGTKTYTAREETAIPTPISHQLPETEDGGNDGSLESKENGPDPNLEDSAEVPSKDKALSRRTQRSDTNNRRQRLNARDRRKLLALKGKKMTLRQVGIQFTHLDTDILRQVWGELNLPERCTRSRTMRKK